MLKRFFVLLLALPLLAQTTLAPQHWTFVSLENVPDPVPEDPGNPLWVTPFTVLPGQTLRYGTNSCAALPGEHWSYLTNVTPHPIQFVPPFNLVFGDPAVTCGKELDSLDPQVYVADPGQVTP